MNPTPGPTNLVASVRARLFDLARERNDEFQLVLSEYATERFLHRLGVSRFAERFVLKGAMVLRLWSPGRYRPTESPELVESMAEVLGPFFFPILLAIRTGERFERKWLPGKNWQ